MIIIDRERRRMKRKKKSFPSMNIEREKMQSSHDEVLLL